MKIEQKISVIVKAYNEQENIARVLKPLTSIKWIDEIIVVDDGSTDKTAEIVQSFKTDNLKLVRHQQNQGMGAGMATGITSAKHDLLVFLDADLVGLREEHLLELLSPIVFTKQADLVLGVFSLQNLSEDSSTKIANRFIPMITGQRAIWKNSLPPIDKIRESRYGADLLIAQQVPKNRRAVVKLNGLSQIIKEKKKGASLAKSFKARFIMYHEVSKVFFKKKD